MPIQELNNVDLLEMAEEMVENIANEDVIIQQEEEVVPAQHSDTDSESPLEKKVDWTPSGMFEQPEYDNDDDKECEQCKVDQDTEESEIQSWQCTHNKQTSSSFCPHNSVKLNDEGFFICVLCDEEL